MAADSRTDAELIGLIAGGDSRAFEELHRRYARSVLGIALRRIGDRGRAEDATQDTFASVWRSAARYDPARGQAASWLYTVARNAIVDGLRRTPAPTVADPPEIAATRPGARRRRRDRVGVVARPPSARDASGARAHARGAGLLERPLPERDRRLRRAAARYRQDADAGGPAAPRRRAGRRAPMTDVRDIIGDDVEPGELERLERVHALLEQAGPPPELSPGVEHAPSRRPRVSSRSRAATATRRSPQRRSPRARCSASAISSGAARRRSRSARWRCPGRARRARSSRCSRRTPPATGRCGSTSAGSPRAATSSG